MSFILQFCTLIQPISMLKAFHYVYGTSECHYNNNVYFNGA